MADLDTIRDGWDHAAKADAMGNIVTLHEYQGGRWPADKFFEHGRREIDAMLQHLDDAGVEYRTGRALDFGCGVGRLTQALAEHFKRVDGVDIAPQMVEQARSHNKHPGRVEYHLNTDRIPFRDGTFDLVYSRITLQHMPAPLQKGYVGEFVRLLKRGGRAVFQIPDGPVYRHPNDWLSMYGVPRAVVKEWVAELGADLLDVELLEDGSGVWQAYRYTIAPKCCGTGCSRCKR